MNNILIPDEKEFKQWVKEVLKEFFSEHSPAGILISSVDEPLLPAFRSLIF